MNAKTPARRAVAVIAGALVIAATSAACLADAGAGTHAGFQARSLIKPLGIATLSLIALTICLARLRRVRRLNTRLVMRLHKASGVCTLCVGIIHATIIFVFHG